MQVNNPCDSSRHSSSLPATCGTSPTPLHKLHPSLKSLSLL